MLSSQLKKVNINCVLAKLMLGGHCPDKKKTTNIFNAFAARDKQIKVQTSRDNFSDNNYFIRLLYFTIENCVVIPIGPCNKDITALACFQTNCEKNLSLLSRCIMQVNICHTGQLKS